MFYEQKLMLLINFHALIFKCLGPLFVEVQSHLLLWTQSCLLFPKLLLWDEPSVGWHLELVLWE